LKNHSWNDHISAADVNGHLHDINNWIRRQHSTWLTGCASTVTAGANLYYDVAAGTALQLHVNPFGAVNMTSGDPVYIVNDPVSTYKRVTNLNTITVDSTGTSITNRYFKLVFLGIVNSDGESTVLVNLPSGSYSASAADAQSDASNYANFTLPEDFRGTGFLLYSAVVRVSGGTWTSHIETDLRGVSLVSSAGGGSGGGASKFSDASFAVFNSSDITKEVAFNVGGVTTSTTRTWTVQDKDGTVAMLSDITGAVQVNEYSSPGGVSWTKPTGAVMVEVVLIGGGGGGGGGGSGGANRGGGGGGAGGNVMVRRYEAGDLAATESVFVGAGGAGGAGNKVSAVGANGTAGTNSTFSSSGTLCTAHGGKAGLGGTTTGQAGGGELAGIASAGVNPQLWSHTLMGGGAGGDGSDTGTASGGFRAWGPCGGGGGGGHDGSTNAYNGGAGGGDPTTGGSLVSGGGAAGTWPGGISGGGSGTSGSSRTTAIGYGGQGGGGGAGGVGGGGSGGAGGGYGAGGGGGGASIGTSKPSGSGGAGATGHAWVITYF
jgi:hypothetical protein